MMTGEKGSRLSKVARELNVGITTLVDFLHKQGHKISTDPNTKIEADVHELLEKQFRKDHEARIEADKVNLRHHRAKNEAISIEDLHAVKKEPEDAETDDDSIMIKDHSLHYYKEEKRADQDSAERKIEPAPVHPKQENIKEIPIHEAVPATEVEKPQITVVGQIDLNNLNRKPKAKEVKPEKPVKEEPVKIVPPVEQVKIETVVQIPEVQPVPEPTVEIDQAPVIEQTEEEIKTEAKIDLISNRSQIENNIKVIGKIDLNLSKPSGKPAREIIKKKLTTRKSSEDISKPHPAKKDRQKSR